MDFVTPVLDWIAAHPNWAGVVVFLIACSESLAVVGLFLPGAVLMFGAGALVGSGALALLPTLVWGTAGAIVGDGISFWLGRHFHGQLREMWPFRTHPWLIQNAIGFFERHGGKSILLGRFIGPIRPVIPAVAGMMDMPWARFLPVNVVSGVLWAPVYVIPGMVFAASFGLAAEVAGRLASAAGLLLTLLVVVVWLVRRTFDFLHPRTHALLQRVLLWSSRHPLVGRTPAALLDPGHPEARGLTLLALVLLAAGAAFAVILHLTTDGHGLLPALDSYVYHSLQALRTPWMDHLLTRVAALGDRLVLAGLFAGVLAALAWRRDASAVGHWVAAGLFALAVSGFSDWASGLARPVAVASRIFPGGDVGAATVLYGFLAVLLAREVGVGRRPLIYAAAAVWVTAIAFARLYLGARWLSDVLGGLSLGLAWVALLGIAYSRHHSAHLALRGLLAGALASVALAAGLDASLHFEQDLERYAIRHERLTQTAGQWRAGGWRELHARRGELFGDAIHPLNLQYAGDLEVLEQRLAAAGWHPPPRLDAVNWLRWLSSTTALAERPVLPQVHAGFNEQLRLVRPAADDGLWVVRLWPSPLRLVPGERPVWVGYAGRLEAQGVVGLLTLPRTADGFDPGLAALREGLAGMPQWVGQREALPGVEWSGTVLGVEEH